MSNADNVITEIKDLEAQYIAGALPASEYQELLEDIKSTKAIEAAAGDLALKTQIHQLIDGLITASKLI